MAKLNWERRGRVSHYEAFVIGVDEKPKLQKPKLVYGSKATTRQLSLLKNLRVNCPVNLSKKQAAKLICLHLRKLKKRK